MQEDHVELLQDSLQSEGALATIENATIKGIQSEYINLFKTTNQQNIQHIVNRAYTYRIHCYATLQRRSATCSSEISKTIVVTIAGIKQKASVIIIAPVL